MVWGIDALDVAEKDTLEAAGVESNHSLCKADRWDATTTGEAFSAPVDADERESRDGLWPDLEVASGLKRLATCSVGFPGTIQQISEDIPSTRAASHGRGRSRRAKTATPGFESSASDVRRLPLM